MPKSIISEIVASGRIIRSVGLFTIRDRICVAIITWSSIAINVTWVRIHGIGLDWVVALILRSDGSSDQGARRQSCDAGPSGITTPLTA